MSKIYQLKSQPVMYTLKHFRVRSKQQIYMHRNQNSERNLTIQCAQ